MAKEGKSGEERAMNKPRKETYGVWREECRNWPKKNENQVLQERNEKGEAQMVGKWYVYNSKNFRKGIYVW